MGQNAIKIQEGSKSLIVDGMLPPSRGVDDRRSGLYAPSFRIGEIRTPDHISTLRLDKSLYAGSFHPGIGGTNMAYGPLKFYD